MIEAGAGWGEAGLRGAGKGVRHSTTQPVGPGGHETKCLETGTIRLILPESKAVSNAFRRFQPLFPLFFGRAFSSLSPLFFFFGRTFSHWTFPGSPLGGGCESA